VAAIVAGIRHHWANVEICPDHAFIDLPFSESRSIAGIPVLRLISRPMEGWAGVVKWLEDKALGLGLTILALPLLALIAAIIRLDSPGPILFRQKRFGFSGREFTLYKFRTMNTEDDGHARQASRNDSRVTRFGRILRRTSLDELPQLFNVLNGTMSLVGPRPHAVPHNLHFAPRIDQYLARHRIKPGITGWAQIHGLRGETVTLDSMRQRVAHDIFYIENWSPELDALILLRTVIACLGGRNAY
jgi:exopolysaccharide biosynthesis polyprenyl glycosylphosphotransferase